MNELIDLKAMWKFVTNFWRNNLGTVIFCAIAFVFGGLLATKSIVDDCKFSGVFRSGIESFSCQQMVRPGR